MAPTAKKRAPAVAREDYIQRLKKGLCTRCGSEEHKSDQCDYLPAHPLHDTLHSRASPLGSFGAGEDQIREAVLGKVVLPSRYQFLHEPSPTRNTKSIRGQVTTSPASALVAETLTAAPMKPLATEVETATVQGENMAGTAGDDMATVPCPNNRVHPGRVHIIGTHELAKLAAHSLASIKGRPPITFLMHSETLIKKWRAEGESIVLVRDGKADTRIGFDIERQSLTEAEHGLTSLLGTGKSVTGDSPWLIKQLIVADDGWNTLVALNSIRDRLNSDSSILFLQDNEGVIDRVNEQIFQNPSSRPQYIRAHSTHGLMNHPTRIFAVKHFKQGEILLSDTEGRGIAQLKTSHPSAFNLLGTFEDSPALSGVAKPMQLLLYHKLQRLTIDSVIGCLSVALDCKILDLRYNYWVSENLREMLKEICAVVHKMPELSPMAPDAMETFSVDNLEKLAAELCNQMQQDAVHPMAKLVANGRRTDVQFRTGYFIELGKKFNVPTPVCLSMSRLVKAKQAMNQKRLQNWVPFDKNPHPGSKA